MSHLDESNFVKGKMKLRHQIKAEASNSIELELDDAFYEQLHNKIMAAVDEIEIQPASRYRVPKQMMKRHWRSLSQISLALLMLFGVNKTASQYVLSLWSSSHTVKLVQNEKEIIHQALASPDEFSNSMISYQSNNDFFMEVASRNLDQTPAEQIPTVMEEFLN